MAWYARSSAHSAQPKLMSRTQPESGWLLGRHRGDGRPPPQLPGKLSSHSTTPVRSSGTSGTSAHAEASASTALCYQVNGTQRGSAPATHPDLGRRVQAENAGTDRCTADGWLPSLGYLPGGPADLAEANKRIDDAALAAGREPGHIRRLINIGGQFSTISRGSFSGPPEQWAEELAELTLDHGITGFILAADDADSIELFATEVAPATRQLVAEERRLRGTRRSDQVE